MKEYLMVSGDIQEKIENIRETYKADRIWINQFHNGGHFYPTGKSMQKFSATYESCSSSKFSSQGQFQNIPISLFAKMHKTLLEKGKLIVKDFNGNLEKYGLENMAEQTNTRSTYIFAINTFDDKFIGCLGIDFCEKANNIVVDQHLFILRVNENKVTATYM
jgi:hypothetical protein